MPLVSSCLCLDQRETLHSNTETQPGAACTYLTKERYTHSTTDRTEVETHSTSPKNPNYVWNRFSDPQ